jgi:hypothetical protein
VAGMKGIELHYKGLFVLSARKGGSANINYFGVRMRENKAKRVTFKRLIKKSY